jgi:hypothetical protein
MDEHTEQENLGEQGRMEEALFGDILQWKRLKEEQG